MHSPPISGGLGPQLADAAYLAWGRRGILGGEPVRSAKVVTRSDGGLLEGLVTFGLCEFESRPRHPDDIPANLFRQRQAGRDRWRGWPFAGSQACKAR